MGRSFRNNMQIDKLCLVVPLRSITKGRVFYIPFLTRFQFTSTTSFLSLLDDIEMKDTPKGWYS